MSKGLRKWPTEQIYRLVELWADPTKSVAAIARELGVDCATVIRRAEYLALRPRLASKSS
jgi:transposase-like protein